MRSRLSTFALRIALPPLLLTPISGCVQSESSDYKAFVAHVLPAEPPDATAHVVAAPEREQLAAVETVR